MNKQAVTFILTVCYICLLVKCTYQNGDNTTSNHIMGIWVRQNREEVQKGEIEIDQAKIRISEHEISGNASFGKFRVDSINVDSIIDTIINVEYLIKFKWYQKNDSLIVLYAESELSKEYIYKYHLSHDYDTLELLCQTDSLLLCGALNGSINRLKE